GMQAKNARKKLRRRSLIVGRDDGVVEGDGHRKRLSLPQTYRSKQTIDRPHSSDVKGFAGLRMWTRCRPRANSGNLSKAEVVGQLGKELQCLLGLFKAIVPSPTTMHGRTTGCSARAPN